MNDLAFFYKFTNDLIYAPDILKEFNFHIPSKNIRLQQLFKFHLHEQIEYNIQKLIESLRHS